jgi:hypothetical protein
MSLVSKAKKIRDALVSVEGLKCYHLQKPASVTAPYAVWQEDSEGDSHYSDNLKSEQVLQATIDYFTKSEYDTMTDSIQSALNREDISWTLNSFQYEDETKLLHYEWLVKVI